jgi:DNA (cytosine-5)-methyltransferase 1
MTELNKQQELWQPTTLGMVNDSVLPANISVRLLDLCCKAGGCSMGYFLAAKDLGIDIEIIGVDIEPQPNYPFRFIKADAVEYLKANWQNFTHIHASPPCQEYSVSTTQFKKKGKKYRDNLHELKFEMKKTGLPGVLENVMPAPISGDIVLRGDMFGLKVLRKRKFELINWFAMAPTIGQKFGSVKNGDYAQVVGKGQLKTTNGKKFKIPGNNITEVWRNAMQIDWMTKEELAQAIPPAYMRYIGRDFFKA